jgi:predicted ATPase
MLTRLQFKNFKAWPDSGDIRLAPLTVLFGTNSAGKTSIPQLLLMLKQTAASPDRQRALQLGDSRSLVELGVYEDIVYRHEMARTLEIALEWQAPEAIDIHDPISGDDYSGDRFAFRVKIRGDKKHQPVVQSFRYDVRADDRPALGIELRRSDNDKKHRRGAGPHGPAFALHSSQYRLVPHTGRRKPLPEPQRFYGFPDEVTAYYQNTAFTSDLALALEKQLRSLYYVGPLRDYPSRLYVWSGETPEHVGVKGEKTIEAILAGQERTFTVKPGERKRTLPELVAARLRAMGLIRDFQVVPLAKHRKEYEVLVKTGPHMPAVKLTDVGFGVSQILPVIVECLYVPAHSVVIFEQPEIHLHPRVQAELADLFVDAIRARENGQPRHCQFIIESHSEHFLRRLQRRVAEEEISPDDTALYFVHTERDHARLEALDVDRFGNIRNWPQSFFGDEMEDLVARAKAQSSRMHGTTGTSD